MNDRYEIREQLGQGGLGAVYRAYDTQLRREVALKRVITPTQESVENLQHEATALSSLMHPNIVTVFDVGQGEEGGFVVMELLDGETLDETIERAPLTLSDFVEVVNQTLEALIAAQAVKMTHRDLKPGNVMVIWRPSGKFQIKILDFGLAKVSETPSRQTIDQEEGIMGSIYFMAPEQFERGSLDFRTDMYALGCIYYYCLTGEYPFDGDTAPQVMMAHLHHQVKPLEERRPDIPLEVSQWVMWLMNRNPEDRPASAREALDRFPDLTRPTPVSSGAIPTDGSVRASPAPPVEGSAGAARPTSSRVPTVPGRQTGRVTSGSGPVATTSTGQVPTRSAAAAARAAAEQRTAKRNLIVIIVASSVSALLLLVVGGIIVSGQMRAAKDLERIEELADVALGEGEDVRLLLKHISEDPNRNDNRALRILTELRGTGVDEALQRELAKAGPGPQRLALLQVVANRSLEENFPSVLEIYQETENKREREAAAYTMARIARPGDEMALLELLESESMEASERSRIEEAVTSILYRNRNVATRTDPLLNELNTATGAYRKSLARILGSLGGEKTLDRLSRVFSTVQEDKTYQYDMMLALNNWPNRGCKSLLERLMEDEDKALRTVAARAYVRMLTLPSQNPNDVASYRKVLDTVERNDVRRVFGAMVANPTPPTLKFCQEAKYPGLDRYFNQAADQIQMSMRKALVIRPGALIPAGEATILGEGNGTYYDDESELIQWRSPQTWMSWVVKLETPGTYQISVLGSCPEMGGSALRVTLSGFSMSTKTVKTGEGEIESFPIGTITVRPQQTGVKMLYLSTGNVVQPRIMQVQGIEFSSG